MVDAVRLHGPEASNRSLPALGAADHTECSQSEVKSTPPTNSTNNSTESASDAWSTVACSEECLGPAPGFEGCRYECSHSHQDSTIFAPRHQISSSAKS
jgi:hypothetical protein